jgi:hypothetical protein
MGPNDLARRSAPQGAVWASGRMPATNARCCPVAQIELGGTSAVSQPGLRGESADTVPPTPLRPVRLHRVTAVGERERDSGGPVSTPRLARAPLGWWSPLNVRPSVTHATAEPADGGGASRPTGMHGCLPSPRKLESRRDRIALRHRNLRSLVVPERAPLAAASTMVYACPVSLTNLSPLVAVMITESVTEDCRRLTGSTPGGIWPKYSARRRPVRTGRLPADRFVCLGGRLTTALPIACQVTLPSISLMPRVESLTIGIRLDPVEFARVRQGCPQAPRQLTCATVIFGSTTRGICRAVSRVSRASNVGTRARRPAAHQQWDRRSSERVVRCAF